MTIIKINNTNISVDGSTYDSVKYHKDCKHFKNLNDGSIIGEYNYCDLSLRCRQVDILPDGTMLPMEARRLLLYDSFGNVVAEELFCTGMHDLRPLKERIEDDKAS